MSQPEIFSVRLGLDEMLADAQKYGGKRVRIVHGKNRDHFGVFIDDGGEGFDPGDLPNPVHEQFIERHHGRGWFLLNEYLPKMVQGARGYRLPIADGSQNSKELYIKLPVQFSQGESPTVVNLDVSDGDTIVSDAKL
jgi:hypothetical protein